MKHEYTVEILYHFTCGSCKNWWSYALTSIMGEDDEWQTKGPERSVFCPHCGDSADVEIKK